MQFGKLLVISDVCGKSNAALSGDGQNKYGKQSIIRLGTKHLEDKTNRGSKARQFMEK